MKRIDDFVKLLVGLVVGQFLRDASLIRNGLMTAMHTRQSLLAELFPFFFVAFVIRNVHASFRWDAWTEARRFSPQFAKQTFFRGFFFWVGIAAMFASPYAVEHILAAHLSVADANGQLPDVPAHITLLNLFLALPFAIYFVWDVALWLLTDKPVDKKDRVIQRFIRKWLVVDLIGLGLLFVFFWMYVVIGPSSDHLLRLSLAAFSTIALLTVVGDYTWNASFYFREIKTLAAAKEVPPPA